MTLPKRPPSHLSGDLGYQLLETLAPATWIVREPPKRDYGVDAYVEVTSPDWEMTGDLFLAQIKASERPHDWSRESPPRSHSVKTSTVRYWMGFNVPFFLFEADLASKQVYYVCAQPAARMLYAEIEEQESISFPLDPSSRLGYPGGERDFRIAYATERQTTTLVAAAAQFLSSFPANSQRINKTLRGYSRFSWDLADPEEAIWFRSLYENYATVCQCLRLEQHFKLKEDGSLLTRGTMDSALRVMAGQFVDLASWLHTKFTGTEKAYWA